MTGTTVSKTPSPSAAHILRIDVLRGMAILMVFCFHLLTPILGDGWEQYYQDFPNSSRMELLPFYPFTSGWAGVYLFYVVSGFCIHLSFLKYNRSKLAISSEAVVPEAALVGVALAGARSSGGFRSNAEKPNAKKRDRPWFEKGYKSWIQYTAVFFQKRFWRIYPPYLVALVCLSLFQIAALANKQGLLNVFNHLLLIHNLNPKTLHGINSSFWTIAVEWQFYLLYPLLLVFRSKFGLRKTFVSITAFTVAYRVLVFLATVSDNSVWVRSPFMAWFDWMLGLFLAEAWFQRKRLFDFSDLQVGASCLALFLANFFLIRLYEPFFIYWQTTFVTLILVILVDRYLHITGQITLIEKALTYVGLCSYSFYLIHQPLISVLIKVFSDFDWTNVYLSFSLGAVIIFLPIWGVSWLSYRYIEMPSAAFGKRWNQAKKTSV